MFQPLRIKLLKTWAHKAILQKITMMVFITWIGYRVFMVDPSEINNDYDENNLEFAKLPWAYAFQLYSRDIRGKHLSFLPRIRVPFDPSGSRPIPVYQETKDSRGLTQFSVSWKLVSLIIAFAAAIYKLYKAYERKIEINKSFVEYFDSGKSSKSLFEDVELEKHLELQFTIDHVAQDEETGNLLLVDSSGSLTIFDALSNKTVAQKLSQISSYRASTTSDSRHHHCEDDNPLISDDETVWSVGIHQNNIILGLSSGNVKFLEVSKAEMLLKSTYLLDESGVSFIITRDEESAFIALTIEGTVRKFATCPFSAHEVQHSTPGVTVVRAMCERIVTGSLDGSVTVLSNDCRTDHVCKGHNYPITALNLFKNGKSSSDITAMSADQSGQVRIWTLLSGRCQFVLGNYSGMISNVWPCRDILIGMTQSGRVLIWTHRSGHFKQSFKLGDSSNGGAIVLNENLLIAAFDQQIGFIDLDLKNKKKINLAAKVSIRENNFKIRSTAMTPSKLFFSQTGDKKTLFFSHGRTLKSLSLPPHIDCTNIS